MKDISFKIAMVTMLLALAACGSTQGERTLTGAGIGAGAGALGNAAIGGSPWTGAAIGGAAGGVIGATR